MQSLSEQIPAAARSWIGTGFHHQGRLKKTNSHKGGVDCLGLLVGVASELGLKDKNGVHFLHECDELAYGHYPNGIRLRARLAELLVEIPVPEYQVGDIALFLLDGQPRHVGIISDYPQGCGLIHAYAPARKVVETVLDEVWQQRLVAVFRPRNAT